MSEAQRIAAELTEAQRYAMRNQAWRAIGSGEEHIPFATHSRCRAALQERGLVEAPMYSTRLTPLGLEVRKIIEAQS